MSVNFYALRSNADGEEPINLHSSDDTNMGNLSAAAVLGSMRLLPAGGVFVHQLVPIAKFRQGLMLALNTGRPEAHAEHPYAESEPGKARFFHLGMPSDRIRGHLEMLRDWTERMAGEGATLVYWA